MCPLLATHTECEHQNTTCRSSDNEQTVSCTPPWPTASSLPLQWPTSMLNLPSTYMQGDLYALFTVTWNHHQCHKSTSYDSLHTSSESESTALLVSSCILCTINLSSSSADELMEVWCASTGLLTYMYTAHRDTFVISKISITSLHNTQITDIITCFKKNLQVDFAW